MASATEWVNDLGRRKYQPTTTDGEREWLRTVTDTRGYPALPRWEYPEHASELKPRLYRSRLHASFRARRRERRKAADIWNERA